MSVQDGPLRAMLISVAQIHEAAGRRLSILPSLHIRERIQHRKNFTAYEETEHQIQTYRFLDTLV
jgi:hypothetical protein